MVNTLREALIDNAKCFAVVRDERWPERVRCPHCGAAEITKRGFHSVQAHRQRYECQACARQLTTLRRRSLKRIINRCGCGSCACLHGPEPIQPSDCGRTGPRSGRCAGHDRPVSRREHAQKKPVSLSGEVECDEVYVVAGHKGHPEIVAQLGRPGRRRRLKGKRGRGTLAGEKPPLFGRLQRTGEVVIQMLDNVQQATLQPIITETVQAGSRIYTDEYASYARLTDWGYIHKTVNHGHSDAARDRDEDGDACHENHVNTLEGVWSLLRSWLSPHRGISQENVPWYLGFFEFVRNVRRRGKVLLAALLSILLAPGNPG